MFPLFRRALFCLCLFPLSGFSETEMTWDNAGIYSETRGAPEKSLIQSLAPKAKISEEKDGEKTKFTCQWPDVTVTINIDPHWNLADQIHEMKRFIEHFTGKENTSPSAAMLLKKLDATADCYGCVITPHYDPEGKAAALLLSLAAKRHGVVFTHQSFYDTDGNRIIGVADDPAVLPVAK